MIIILEQLCCLHNIVVMDEFEILLIDGTLRVNKLIIYEEIIILIIATVIL